MIDWFGWKVWIVILIVIIILIWLWTSNSKEKEFVGLKPLYDAVDIPTNSSTNKGDTIEPELAPYDIDEAYYISAVKIEKVVPHPYSRVVDEETLSTAGNTPIAPIRKKIKTTLLKDSQSIMKKSNEVVEKNKELSLLVLDEKISPNIKSSVDDEKLSMFGESGEMTSIEIPNIELLNIKGENSESSEIKPFIIGELKKADTKNKSHKHKSKKKEYKSIGEELTCKAFSELLDDPDIKVNIRPKFLKNPKTGRCLEIDCWSEKYQIGAEYNGIQHYQFPCPFFSSTEEFEEQLYRDEIKRELADENDKPIITVPCLVDSYVYDEEKVTYKHKKRSKDKRYELIKQYMREKLEPILLEKGYEFSIE
jgi:hypothetical protein